MNNLQVFKNDLFQVSIKLENGQTVFDVETVAKSLGISRIATSGNEVVRWERVNKYLESCPQVGMVEKGSFIPESAVYKLAFKASNEVAEKFQDWLAIDVLPQIRQTGGYIPTKSMTQAELTAAIAQNQVQIERTANTALEVANKVSKQITNALDVFTAPVKDGWRHEMNEKVNQMCINQGLNYQGFRHEIYVELENTARVDLASRQVRLRTRMRKGGSTTAECKAISKLDIVERDPKLKPIFEGIVRRYQAKYAVV